jgi:glucose-1-phosphate adenylyltransferase
VDIPISNCINSGFNQIYLLTQFNTASLHKHIQQSYVFDPFGRGRVDILAAEQTLEKDAWYQGTADAVRQNLHHFAVADSDLVIILSGDQLFRMNLRALVIEHQRAHADLTIATKAVAPDAVLGLGVSRVNDTGEIVGFVEKPTDPAVIASLVVTGPVRDAIKDGGDAPYCLASMGIYVFSGRALRDALADGGMKDFGKEVIPSLLGKRKIQSYVFNGYWEDIGTVRSFWEANLALTDPVPLFNFFDSERPIYSHARFLPPAKLNGGRVERVVLSEGSIITNADLSRCVIGVRSVIRDGSRLRNVVMLGADFHEVPWDFAEDLPPTQPGVGVGANCRISDAIIDKNARIGDNVVLSPEGVEEKWETNTFYKRDGVLIVKKNAVIPSGTVVGKIAD